MKSLLVSAGQAGDSDAEGEVGSSRAGSLPATANSADRPRPMQAG